MTKKKVQSTEKWLEVNFRPKHGKPEIKLVHGDMFGEHESHWVFARSEDLLASAERFRFCSWCGKRLESSVSGSLLFAIGSYGCPDGHGDVIGGVWIWRM